MNDTQCLLWAAQMLISDPKDWVQGCAATDADGASAEYCKACKFCAWGAIHAVEPTWDAANNALDVLRMVARSHGCGSVPAFNDKHNHAAVMAAFDRAIELAA